ncbi:MAG TPA: hypothetical protein VL860_09850, partial [Planctomycetota bacterium]|nr:hypothetical protein [Planctomycetota bacterium]
TGIWRPVELICVDRARIADVRVRTRSVKMNKRRNEARTAASARMEAQVTVEPVARYAGQPLTVEFTVEPPAGASSPSARRVFRQEITAPSDGAPAVVTFGWTVEAPQLWWPNGSGDAKLYGYRVRLFAGEVAVDSKQHHFGIRTVVLDRSRTADGGHRYAFVINGREIFVRGWNWTPPDAIFARITDDRRRTLVRMAAESGANMLRVWGGGYYEPQAFFDACDKAGLLVHQDFMMACAKHPQTAAFQAELRAEAESIVKAYRSHPSLALWSGDNECDAMYKNPRTNGLTRKVLPAVVKRLDPDTPYIPSSPDSPNNKAYNDLSDSDVHLWNHGASYRDAFFLGVKAKFVSEIGFLSLPGVETAQAMHGDVPAWPANNPVWDLHAADCMRGKFFRGMDHVLKDFASCGRPAPKSLEEYVRVSQELQAEAYKTWALHFGAIPECAGILLWNLADCWPQMSDAVIAYPMDVKPALAAAAEAFQQIGRR